MNRGITDMSGNEVASEIYSQGICLEEYIDTLD